MSQPNAKAQTPYQKKLFWRKVRMYAMWGLTSIACLIVTLTSFHQHFFNTIDPQIRSAYGQMARLMPELEANVHSLYQTYEALTKSRGEAKKMGITLSSDTLAETRTARDILSDSFAVERITRLNVGHNGIVAVAWKDTGEIITHRNEAEIGNTLLVSPLTNSDLISTEKGSLFTSVVNFRGVPDLDLESFGDEKAAEGIQLRHMVLCSGENGRFRLSTALGNMLFGSIVPYGPYYIVCGIDMWDYLLYVSRAVFISMIVSAVLWLFVHYISLMLDRHELSGREFFRRLAAFSLLLVLGLGGASWYVQVLNSVTNDLTAMENYADAGVDDLKSFEDTRERLNEWFDEQYLVQCRIARDYAKSYGKEFISREDLAELSKKLGIQYIYIYDKNGRVTVTNSPYDHLQVTDESSDPLRAFLPLLEGADHVILEPMADGISGARSQLIGVSLRDDGDLCDGFVQISVDPELRDYLTKPLGLDSVLTDMTVGLPTGAIAVSKKDLTIAASDGFGYVGQSLEEYGYNAEKLRTTRSGFLRHGDKSYYAGFGESDKYYMIPVAERVADTAALLIAVRVALVTLAGLALILLMALFHYQRSVVDDAPPPEPVVEDPAPEKPDPAPGSILKAQEKYGFEDRWHVKVSKAELTPGERVKAIAYWLVLIFCVFNVLPLIYGSLSNSKIMFSGLSYVLAGNWERGVNIFAFTSCLFLLFALYVFVTLANRMLYSMAKDADLRMETIYLLLRSSLKYVVIIAFIYYGLSQFGIPTQALLASAGILTLAVSMGAKDLVNDIIAGFFLLLEGNIKVGDFVTVGSWYGFVQEIGVRTTRINFYQDTKIVNNSSLRDIVNCDQAVSRMTLKIPVSLTANLGQIEEILMSELPTLMEGVDGMVKAPKYSGIDGMKDGCMNLRLVFYAKTGKHLGINREFQRRIKLMFERHNYTLPVNPVFYFEEDAPKDKAD